MQRITVFIGQFAYSTVDGGQSWVKQLREIPAKTAPVIQGKLDPSRLPQLKRQGAWDFATVLDCGAGAVAAHEFDESGRPNQGSRLCLFLTNNAGASWRRLEMVELLGPNLDKEQALAAERADALAQVGEF